MGPSPDLRALGTVIFREVPLTAVRAMDPGGEIDECLLGASFLIPGLDVKNVN